MVEFANSLRSLNASSFVNSRRRNCPFKAHNPPLSGHSNFPATFVIPKPTLLPVNRTPTVSPSKYATIPSNNKGPAGIETGSNSFQSLIVCKYWCRMSVMTSKSAEDDECQVSSNGCF